MASITYLIIVRDSSGNGTRMTGLAPTWVHLKRLSDNANLAQPAISEIGQGQYKFSYDAEVDGEAAGQIDAGATLTRDQDRYIDVMLTRDSGRLDATVSSRLATAGYTAPDNAGIAAAASSAAAAVAQATQANSTASDIEAAIGGLSMGLAEPYVTGATEAGSTAASIIGDSGLSDMDGIYQGSFLSFTSGPLKGVPRQILDYDGAARTFSVSPFPAAPAEGDAFIVIGLV
jgi:hypothetical protein